MNPLEIPCELEALPGFPWSRDLTLPDGSRVVQKWDGAGELHVAVMKGERATFARIKVDPKAPRP